MKLFAAFDLEESFYEPNRAYQGDAGYDLYACRDGLVEPGKLLECDTNTCVELPKGWFAMIQERSSQGRARLMTLGNVIDEGYRGGMKVMLLNLSPHTVVVHAGDKVGQLVLMPRYVDPREHVLPKRGANGYGSSGGKHRSVPTGYSWAVGQ